MEERSERLAAALEDAASKLMKAEVVTQGLVVNATSGLGGGSVVGMSISVSGGSGSGDVVGLKVSAGASYDPAARAIAGEFREAAEEVRAGKPQTSKIHNLLERVRPFVGRVLEAGTIQEIKNLLG